MPPTKRTKPAAFTGTGRILGTGEETPAKRPLKRQREEDDAEYLPPTEETDEASEIPRRQKKRKQVKGNAAEGSMITPPPEDEKKRRSRRKTISEGPSAGDDDRVQVEEPDTWKDEDGACECEDYVHKYGEGRKLGAYGSEPRDMN